MNIHRICPLRSLFLQSAIRSSNRSQFNQYASFNKVSAIVRNSDIHKFKGTGKPTFFLVITSSGRYSIPILRKRYFGVSNTSLNLDALRFLAKSLSLLHSYSRIPAAHDREMVLAPLRSHTWLLYLPSEEALLHDNHENSEIHSLHFYAHETHFLLIHQIFLLAAF